LRIERLFYGTHDIDAVAELMAAPRTRVEYRAEYPEPARWETPRGTA